MGNWNKNPWNRGKARAPQVSGLDPILQELINERVRQNCSQNWFAQKVGWSQGAVNRYENGTDRVPFAYVRAAAEVFGWRLTLQKGGKNG
jgi:DNA-binding XRE family transcriptional regulator